MLRGLIFINPSPLGRIPAHARAPLSFTLAVTFVFMNLFIGVILDGFDAASSGSTDVITQDDFARFAERWADYDPHATCLITVQARFIRRDAAKH